MFQKILIANRGEIACRIIKTAKRMGIATVAVHSDVDRDALHVEMADEAIAIGAAAAADSYLRIDRIIAAAKATGAEAIHPGYGFLSERAAFAEALAGEGIAFIGPNAGAIRAMGDKIESKKMAAAAGVSTVPGHLGVIETEAEAVEIARSIGFPVMIKASAGGGGKGMRIAQDAGEVRDGFRLARSEARSSFGDDRVFIEKFIVNPRHIEIQVLGDRHGTIVHLGERECSIQRRNQKIVEEAPSPLLDAETRARMGAQAVALARAVGYDSAGTVEFVASQDREFYFLEMNTRLQVEHPVTELVTGLDLVEQMIRIAAGEPLGFGQADVRLSGWAIESRLYAEDPYRAFLPSIGRLTRYRPPAEGVHGESVVRNDTGVAEGSEISIHYDPMIAKLCTHAPTREAAVDAMAEALDAFVVDGIRHNIPFLSALMDHPRWREGRLSTGFIADEFPEGFGGIEPDRATLQRLAAVALSMEIALSSRAAGGRRPWREDWAVRIGSETLAFSTPTAGSTAPIEIDMVFPGSTWPLAVVSGWKPGDPVWSGAIDGEAFVVKVSRGTANWRLLRRGVEIVARVMSPRIAELQALMPEKKPEDDAKRLLSPMPGLLLSLIVVEGQAVKAGETLAIVEAMKMENVLRAERDVTIAKVVAREGDSLAVDAVILEFA